MLSIRTGARLCAMTAVGVVLLAGCGGDSDESAGNAPKSDSAAPVKLAFFSVAFQNTWYKAYLEGTERVAKEEGATVEAFDAGFDAQKQYSQVQDAITSGDFDAFVVTAVDGPRLAPLVEDAAAKGIKVVSVATALGPDYTTAEPQYPGVVGAVLTPAATDGVNQVKLIDQACADKDPCEVAYILGQKAYGFDAARLKAMEDALEDKPNIKIVAVAEGGFLADPAFNAAQDILQAHKNLDVIASSGDQMIVGAQKAVVDAGREGSITLIGTGASELAARALEKGEWHSSTVYLPRTGGEIGTKMAIDAARGLPVKDKGVNEQQDLSKIGPVLTPENVSEFDPEWLG